MDFSKLNRDQAFSLLNHLIGAAGSLLATSGAFADDTQMLIIGMLAGTGSLILSVWFNVENLADVATSTFRKLIMLGGTYAVARGAISQSAMEVLAGIMLQGATIAWALFFYRDAPGPNLIGTTVVDAPARV